MPPQQTCCCKGDGVDPCPNCWERATFGCTNPCCWCEELEGLCEGTQEYDSALVQCENDWKNLTPAQRPCGNNFRVDITVPSTLTWLSDGGNLNDNYFETLTFQNRSYLDTQDIEVPRAGPGPDDRATADDSIQISSGVGHFYTSHIKTPGPYGLVVDANHGGPYPFRGDENDLRRSTFYGRHGRCTECGSCEFNEFGEPCVIDTRQCDKPGCCSCGDTGNGTPLSDITCEGFTFEENGGWLRKESDLSSESCTIWGCPSQTVSVNVQPDFTVCDETCSYYGSATLSSGASIWKYIGVRNLRDNVNDYLIDGANCGNAYNPSCTSQTCRDYAWQCSDCAGPPCMDEYCLNDNPDNFQARSNQKVKIANLDVYDVPIVWTVHYHLRAVKIRSDQQSITYPNSRYFWEQSIRLTWSPDWSGITIAEGTSDIYPADPIDHQSSVSQNQILQNGNSYYADDPRHGIYTRMYTANTRTCKPGDTDDCHNTRGCGSGTPWTSDSFPGGYGGFYAPGVNFRKSYLSPDSFSDEVLADAWFGDDFGSPISSSVANKVFYDAPPRNVWDFPSTCLGEPATKIWSPYHRPPGTCPNSPTGSETECPDRYTLEANAIWFKRPDKPTLHGNLLLVEHEYTYDYVWGWELYPIHTDVTGTTSIRWNPAKIVEDNKNPISACNFLWEEQRIAIRLTPRDTDCANNCPTSLDGNHPITNWNYNGWQVSIGDF